VRPILDLHSLKFNTQNPVRDDSAVLVHVGCSFPIQ
jgi:hypothetical protein